MPKALGPLARGPLDWNSMNPPFHWLECNTWGMCGRRYGNLSQSRVSNFASCLTRSVAAPVSGSLMYPSTSPFGRMTCNVNVRKRSRLPSQRANAGRSSPVTSVTITCKGSGAREATSTFGRFHPLQPSTIVPASNVFSSRPRKANGLYICNPLSMMPESAKGNIQRGSPRLSSTQKS